MYIGAVFWSFYLYTVSTFSPIVLIIPQKHVSNFTIKLDTSSVYFIILYDIIYIILTFWDEKEDLSKIRL